MNRSLLAAVVALGLTLALPGFAAEVKQLGADATPDQIKEQLAKPAGQPALHFRGLHLLTSNPAAETQMPAVGLDIRFKLNSAELSEEAKTTIKHLAAAINSDELAHYHFLIEGHTDATGTADHNLVLSKERAQTVRNYLVSQYRIAPDRLEAVGRGQTQPINPSDPTNPANRRVQVVNLGQ